jgi:hypothetical protein
MSLARPPEWISRQHASTSVSLHPTNTAAPAADRFAPGCGVDAWLVPQSPATTLQRGVPACPTSPAPDSLAAMTPTAIGAYQILQSTGVGAISPARWSAGILCANTWCCGFISAPTAPDSAPSPAPQALRPQTRLQGGICKPKVYTEGTIRYGCLAFTVHEPYDVNDALANEDWKQAMDSEYYALKKTCHLVPP